MNEYKTCPECGEEKLIITGFYNYRKNCIKCHIKNVKARHAEIHGEVKKRYKKKGDSLNKNQLDLLKQDLLNKLKG